MMWNQVADAIHNFWYYTISFSSTILKVLTNNGRLKWWVRAYCKVGIEIFMSWNWDGGDRRDYIVIHVIIWLLVFILIWILTLTVVLVAWGSFEVLQVCLWLQSSDLDLVCSFNPLAFSLYNTCINQYTNYTSALSRVSGVIMQLAAFHFGCISRLVRVDPRPAK